MDVIDKEFVRQTDEKLILEDVKLHARPFHVAIAWMKEKGVGGDVFDPKIWEPLMEIYRSLYPSGDFSMPSMLVGGVALRDQMYLARVNVGFGTFKVEPLKCIDIPPEELGLIFNHYPDQGWRATYGVCDLWDIAYGIDDLGESTPARDLLKNARSSIAATARILTGDIDVDAAVQTACLAAELGLKGALVHLGLSDAELKKLSHDLPKLAQALIDAKASSDDDRLRSACSNFPDYVGTRYSSHGLTRTQLMQLAMRAQFVVAEALRRITDRDLAKTVEKTDGTAPREQP